MKVRAPERIAPLLVGLGLLLGTAAISSEVAGQGAATTGAGKVDATRIGAARAVENEVEGRLGNAVQKLAVGSEVFQNQLVRTGKASTLQSCWQPGCLDSSQAAAPSRRLIAASTTCGVSASAMRA